MHHLQTLGQLAAAQAQADAQVKATLPSQNGELDLSFLTGNETLKFF